MLSIFRSFDCFPKIEAKYLKQSVHGGITTVIIVSMLTILFLSELWGFLVPKTNHTFVIDTAIEDNILIHMNVSVASECDEISINFGNAMTEEISITNLMEMRSIQYRLNSTHRIHGCNLSGTFSVSNTPGTISIVPMIKIKVTNFGVVNIDFENVNFSHCIHKLSFGIGHEGMKGPLDNYVEIGDNTKFAFQYFISVVPAVYQSYSGRSLRTNQYLVREYAKKANPSYEIPGIFLKYNVEPISVHVTEQRGPLLFLIKLFGIIGGMFTLSGFLYNSVSMFVTKD